MRMIDVFQPSKFASFQECLLRKGTSRPYINHLINQMFNILINYLKFITNCFTRQKT